MERKTTKIKAEKLAAKQRLEEFEKLEKEAQDEEAARVQNVEQSIAKICTDNNMFCGIILTKQDIVSVVSLALESNENVRIPFKLYFNE